MAIMNMSTFLTWLLLLGIFSLTSVHAAVQQSSSTHTSNWAVILSSSQYWFNYRHTINALAIYQVLRENGFEDNQIILMLADEYTANAKNPYPNHLIKNGNVSVYWENVEIDYRGEDVTASQVARVLTGSSSKGKGPVLQSDLHSNILIYWTGHGGNQFFKFQDVEEIMAVDIASIFRHMHLAGMYQEILFLADTCQAFTLGDKITAPNVTVIGSSLKDESSYAHGSNDELGLSLIERYTSVFTDSLQKQPSYFDLSIQEGMVDPFQYNFLRAHVGIRDDLAVRNASEARISDFFKAIPSSFLHRRFEDSRPVLLPDNASHRELPSRILSMEKDEPSSPFGDERTCSFQNIHDPKQQQNDSEARTIFYGGLILLVCFIHIMRYSHDHGMF